MTEPEGYRLVMPLVVCASNGGPYDDEAFVAGANFGRIAATLRLTAPKEFREYVVPALAGQLDLVAMELGYTMRATPWAEYPDGWVLVEFARVAADRARWWRQLLRALRGSARRMSPRGAT